MPKSSTDWVSADTKLLTLRGELWREDSGGELKEMDCGIVGEAGWSVVGGVGKFSVFATEIECSDELFARCVYI